MTSYLAKASDPKQYDLGEVRWTDEGSRDNYFRRLFIESIDEFLGNIKGKRILDVGCGQGWLVDKLSRRGAEVVGIDPSTTNLNNAQNLYPDLHFEESTLEDYASQKKYDALSIIMVFEHILDIEAAFEKVVSLLQPKGRVFIITGDFSKFTKSRFGYTVEREIIEDEIVATKTNYGERMGVLYDINRTPNKYLETAQHQGLSLVAYMPIRPPEWLLDEQEKYTQFAGNSIFHLYVFDSSN